MSGGSVSDGPQQGLGSSLACREFDLLCWIESMLCRVMHQRVRGGHQRLEPWYAERRLPAQVAIKFVERGAGITKNVVREILNHRLCSLHPHIVQVRPARVVSSAAGAHL